MGLILFWCLGSGQQAFCLKKTLIVSDRLQRRNQPNRAGFVGGLSAEFNGLKGLVRNFELSVGTEGLTYTI